MAEPNAPDIVEDGNDSDEITDEQRDMEVDFVLQAADWKEAFEVDSFQYTGLSDLTSKYRGMALLIHPDKMPDEPRRAKADKAMQSKAFFTQ